MSAQDNARITALAGTRAVHNTFSWLHLHEPTIRRIQLESIAIPAPPFHEQARAQYFLQQFTALNLQNPHIDAEGNALAELNPANSSKETPIVLLSAHLDTVFPSTTNCTPREEGQKILAPGATDNAAGLAALFAISAALQHAAVTPACTILFAANVGEEGEGDLRGMRHLFDSASSPYAKRIRAAIALEGAGSAMAVDRALGSRRLRVTVTGPGGHSWADAGRPNAILGLSAALLAIARIPLPRNPRTTLNVGTITGGTSINSIPSTASADLDLRSTTAMQLDRFELTLLKTLEAAIPSPELHLHAERIGNREPGTLPEASPLHRTLRAVDRHLAIATQFCIGSTDANLPLSRHIPALAIGAGGTGGNMHTLDEWYDPTGRDLALRRILLLLLDTCSQIAGGYDPLATLKP
jgi:tripeptide aminopeptidase